MIDCRNASALGLLTLGAATAFGACYPEPTRPDVPPPTTARPSASLAVFSGPATDAGSHGDASDVVADAGPLSHGAAPAVAVASEPPFRAEIVESGGSTPNWSCDRLVVAVAKGRMVVTGATVKETLSTGDVLVVDLPPPLSFTGGGTAILVRPIPTPCEIPPPPLATKKTVVRGAPEVAWAGGKTSAHLDLGETAKTSSGARVAPELYLGRLQSTLPVAEHNHPTSWEILVAIEANGTFTIEGKDGRLGPKQIVYVPPGARHAWSPDPGSKLVAVQVYAPPGPELRFAAQAAADKDSARDAGKR